MRFFSSNNQFFQFKFLSNQYFKLSIKINIFKIKKLLKNRRHQHLRYQYINKIIQLKFPLAPTYILQFYIKQVMYHNIISIFKNKIGLVHIYLSLVWYLANKYLLFYHSIVFKNNQLLFFPTLQFFKALWIV